MFSHRGVDVLKTSSVPIEFFVTSRMQQEFGNLCISHIIDAITMLTSIPKFKQTIRYINSLDVFSVELVNLSNASHGIESYRYAQARILAGPKTQTCVDDEPLFHPSYWI